MPTPPEVARAVDLGTRLAPRKDVRRLHDLLAVSPGLRVLLLVLFVVVDDVLAGDEVALEVKRPFAEVFGQADQEALEGLLGAGAGRLGLDPDVDSVEQILDVGTVQGVALFCVCHVRLDAPVAVLLLFAFPHLAAEEVPPVAGVAFQVVLDGPQPRTRAVAAVGVDGAENPAPPVVDVEQRLSHDPVLPGPGGEVGLAEHLAVQVMVVEPPTLSHADGLLAVARCATRSARAPRRLDDAVTADVLDELPANAEEEPAPFARLGLGVRVGRWELLG